MVVLLTTAANRDAKKEEVLNVVKALDLEPIKYKLVYPEEGEPVSRDRVQKLEKEYKLFLFLNFLYWGQSIVPTKSIDKFWHTHILDTALYSLHCEMIFGVGNFLHHFPYFGIRGEQDKKNLETAFQQTLVLFQKHGQELGLEVSAYCGASCGSSLCDQSACDTNACQSDIGFDVTLAHLYAARPRLAV